MSQIKVRGHSDDIICIEGDLTEEFYPEHDKPGYLCFSDGTVLSVAYTDGFWRIHFRAHGSADYEKVEATDPDDDYSDHVTLTGTLEWVVFGPRFERIRATKKRQP